MKTVYSNREIPHLWMHKTQDNARNANDSLYFDGATIYSYGMHFPIASHVTNNKGEACVYVNPGSYGVTTSRHQSQVRASIPRSVPVFNIYPDTSTVCALLEYVKRLTDAIGVMSRARANAEWKHRTAIEIRTEALAFCTFWDLDASTLPEVPALDSEALALYKAKEAERNKVKREAFRQREIEARKDETERIERWRAGENRGDLYHLPAMLRLSADGSEVETSRGVKVPVDAAKIALEIVREVKASGVPWTCPPAERVSIGHFSLDKVEIDGTLHAGCHVIAFTEIERFAASVGW